MADIIITAASCLPSTDANLQNAIAFETITAGQPVTAAVVAGQQTTVRLADALNYPFVIGLAACGAAANQPIRICTQDTTGWTLGGTVNAGDVVYLSPNSGKVTSTYADILAGKMVQILGIGIGGGKIFLSILRSDVAK
jgi:hypothetical protein